MLEESGDEEETNGIVNKVLDEIGIEISGKVIKIIFHNDKTTLIDRILIKQMIFFLFLDVRCTIGSQRHYWLKVKAIGQGHRYRSTISKTPINVTLWLLSIHLYFSENLNKPRKCTSQKIDCYLV